jgi:glycosyl transferase family 25
MSDATLAKQLKTLVISIKGQEDRRSYISKTLNNLGLNWEFIDAVIGKNLNGFPNEYNASKRLDYFGYHISQGLLGCFLSHRKAWERCIELNQTCLILEDDAKPLPEFMEALQTALDIEDHWDLFRLHGIYEKKYLSLGHIGSFEIIENLKDPSSAAAFIVKPSAAKALLKHSQSFYMANDDFIECRYLHQLSILAIKPYPVNIEHALPTTITDRYKPKLSLKKRLLKEMYQAKHGFKNSIWRIKRRFLHQKINS